MHATCPSCYCTADLEAFLVDGDAKRCLARIRDLDACLVRPVIAYLRLFKPQQRALRWARAAKLVDELAALVEAGSVCRDERNGDRRPAPPALWAAGIEQMVDAPPSGLPLGNHHYLRAVVWALAEQAQAAAERKREEDRRVGRRARGSLAAEDPVANARAYAANMRSLGVFDEARHDQYIAEAIAKLEQP